MLRIFLLVLIALPVIEIVVLLQVGSLLGGLNTLVLIVATAALGLLLVKQQGMQNWVLMQQKLATGEAPGIEILSGVLIFFAGVMLIVPGFVTDVIGLIFVLPPTRQVIARYLLKQMLVPGQTRFGFTQFHFRQGAGFTQSNTSKDDGTVIDGEYSHKPESTGQLDDSTRNSEQKN